MRWAAFLLAGLVVGAALAGLAATILPLVPSSEPPASATEVATSDDATATVTRQTLQVTEELDGTLGYLGDGVLLGGLAGTYTRLPESGDVLGRGDTMAEVDGSVVATLMYGERPAWRALERGVPNGPDVRQLERNLAALGHAADDLEIDGRFDRQTKAAIKRWQKATGQERDGVVELGEVVFLPGPVRVTEVQAQLGARTQPGSVMAATSSTTQVVHVDLEADRQDLIAVGDAVEVELPDDTTASGRVTAIDTVALAGADGGPPTVGVTVTLDDPTASGGLDGAAVAVSIVRQTRKDVLTVPVDALLALREGGYAVEMADDDGSTHLAAVETGLFDDGVVEIRGDIDEGDLVVVPS